MESRVCIILSCFYVMLNCIWSLKMEASVTPVLKTAGHLHRFLFSALLNSLFHCI